MPDEKEVLRRERSTRVRASCWCDAERIGQVVRNLLSNAVKFTPGPAVTMTSRGDQSIAAARGTASIAALVQVIDEGVGIPEARTGGRLRQVRPEQQDEERRRRHRSGPRHLPRDREQHGGPRGSGTARRPRSWIRRCAHAKRRVEQCSTHEQPRPGFLGAENNPRGSGTARRPRSWIRRCAQAIAASSSARPTKGLALDSRR
jgi:hypothetical protein